MVTIEQCKQNEDAIQEKFGKGTAVAYANVSHTIFSVARHYGGATISGKEFVYNPEDDSLIRKDVSKWLTKRLE